MKIELQKLYDGATKKEIIASAKLYIESLIEEDAYTPEIWLKLKAVNEAAMSALKSDKLKAAVIEEISKDAELKIGSAKFTLKNMGDTYDYTEYAEYNNELGLLYLEAKELEEELAEKKARIKTIEKNALGLLSHFGNVVDDNGEVIPKPHLKRAGGQSINVSF